MHDGQHAAVDVARGPQRAPRMVVALLAVVAGCDGCPARKPFTPFSLDETASPSASDLPSTTALQPDAGPPFRVERAIKAPGDGHAWPRPDGGEVSAPPGRTFDTGLWVDADGDGAADLLAWAVAADRSRGELWLAPARGAPRSLVALPADLSQRGCPPATSLSRVGVRFFALEIALNCADVPRDRPGRWLGVLRVGPRLAAELALELRFPSVAPDDALTLAIDGRDRDGDGRDDATISVTLDEAARSGQGAPSVSAELRFFDRPSGMARDPSEPEASLRARASALVAQGHRKTAAAAVPRAARRLRALRDLLCEDGDGRGATSGGSAIRCGDTGSLEASVHAEGLAAVALGDAARALAASIRLEALSAKPGPRRKEIDKALAKLAPEIQCNVVHTVAAVPAVSPRGVGLVPIAFDASGGLLVRTAGPVFRVDPVSFDETASADPWPQRPGAGDDEGLVNVEQRCDPATLVAIVRRNGQHVDVALPVAAPVDADGFGRGFRCAPASAVRAVVFDVDEASAVVAVGPETVTLSFGATLGATAVAGPTVQGVGVPGTARSPDGQTVARPSPRGVLITAPAGASTLWTGAGLGRASACVPTSGARRIACVVDERVLIFEPTP